VSYPDYFCKMTTYIDILSAPAESIESGVSAKTFPVFETTEDESVFMYLDTASSRAGISMIGKKLEPLKIAIIGLGGTGSYVLDLVAKTGVSEIHLYDADKFSSHNAFRSPGAPSLVELRCGRAKVSFFAEKYSNIRRKIFAHDVFIESSNADELREMDFVFLCLDMGSAKSPILKKLKDFSIPFVDVGMGIYAENGALGGTLRVTTYSSAKGDHLDKRISLGDPEGEGAYEQSIQIAELNALNACLAVIKWKKLFKFYLDFENEHHSTYTLDGNVLTNEELA
jgi:hypothetical protein